MSTPQKNNVFTLIQVIFIVLSLIGGVEYFKYSTRINYDWFHCTPNVHSLDGSVKKITSTGGTSCDFRGMTKSILKKLSTEFEPQDGKIVVCLENNNEDGVVGYGSFIEDEEKLKTYCGNVIYW